MRIGKLNCIASINPKQGIDATEHSNNQTQESTRELDNIPSTTFMQCPETLIFIEKIEFNAVIDSGSQISCISQQFFNVNIEILKHCPTLPVQNFQAIDFNKKKIELNYKSNLRRNTNRIMFSNFNLYNYSKAYKTLHFRHRFFISLWDYY